MTGQHLTDEQFTELLSGDCPADASRHMLACTQCQWEFERVQASIEDFVTLSLEWAEKRASASIPRAVGGGSRMAVSKLVGCGCGGPGRGSAFRGTSKKEHDARRYLRGQ